MDKLDFAHTEVLALAIVVESMIAIMDDDKKDLLKNVSASLMDGIIQSNPDTAMHFDEVKKSVDRIIEVGTVKP